MHQISVPADVPTCKKNLVEWLSIVVDLCNSDGAGLAHCWRADGAAQGVRERPTQVEASGKVNELFPNLAAVLAASLPIVDATVAEDPEAGELGKPFTQPEGFGEGPRTTDEEWEAWVDWASLGESSSGA